MAEVIPLPVGHMKTSVVFAVPDFLPIVELSQQAEALGYDRVWTTETPGRDALIRAVTIALRTRTIEVATGIAYAFTRAPLAMAASAADAYVAAGGRFSLGIGAGTQGMRSRWYGIEDFDRPATRLGEYAQALRQAWNSTQEFSFAGDFYRGRAAPLDGARPAVPLWGSGLNRVMLTVAARHFDGVAVHALAAAHPYFDAVVMPALRDGRAGQDSALSIAVWQMTSADDDAEQARQRGRRALAFYFSTPSYGSVAEATGWSDVAERIRTGYRESGPRWDDLGALIPEDMLDEFCLVGTPGELRERWPDVQRHYAERGATELVLQALVGDLADRDSYDSTVRLLDTFAPHSSGG